MSGILGTHDLTGGVTQSIYQCDTDQFTTANISICNRHNVDVEVTLAITDAENAFDDARYIEYATVLKPKGVLERSAVTVPTEKYITVLSSHNAVSAVAYGIRAGDDISVSAITDNTDSVGPVWVTSADITLTYNEYNNIELEATDPGFVTYTVQSGTLPTGITITDGFLRGTPTVPGEYAVTIRATDESGNTSDLVATLAVDALVTQNLRAYFVAGDTASYPGTGTTWFDLSGNGYDATLQGTTAFDAGDSSINLGSTQNTTNYITLDINALQGATEFTIDLWLQRDAANTDLDTFFTMGSGNHALMYQRASNGQIAFENTSATNFSGASFTNGTITNLVMRGVGGTVSLYKDNVLIGSGSNTTTLNGNSTLGIVLGQEMDANNGNFESTQNFRGRYFEVKLYNRSLTTDELNANYANSKARYGF